MVVIISYTDFLQRTLSFPLILESIHKSKTISILSELSNSLVNVFQMCSARSPKHYT